MKGLWALGVLAVLYVVLGAFTPPWRGPLCRCWEHRRMAQAGVDARPCPRHGVL